MELNSFENFIMHCCKLPEWELRDYLKTVLDEAGYDYKEDEYRGHRSGKYRTVHNLLFWRGDPKVCLVAHTDVCRDHIRDNFIPVVNPVAKWVGDDQGTVKKIIQDKNCKVQVGGDDRLGVAINVWIAIHTGYDLALLFTTDEEVGLLSAEKVNFAELVDYKLFVQVDRGNRSNQLVTSIGGVELISKPLAEILLGIANSMGMPREEVRGFATDVVAIKCNHPYINAVNMTCGYHNSIGPSPNEYIDVQEARNTMLYVSSIIKKFDLEYDQVVEFEETYVDFDWGLNQYIGGETNQEFIERLFAIDDSSTNILDDSSPNIPDESYPEISTKAIYLDDLKPEEKEAISKLNCPVIELDDFEYS